MEFIWQNPIIVHLMDKLPVFWDFKWFKYAANIIPFVFEHFCSIYSEWTKKHIYQFMHSTHRLANIALTGWWNPTLTYIVQTKPFFSLKNVYFIFISNFGVFTFRIHMEHLFPLARIQFSWHFISTLYKYVHNKCKQIE